MGAIRALAVAALVALDVSAAAAQPTRGFKDSWFWGVKAGGMTYQVMSDTVGFYGSLGPIGGIDWLITRTRGGLYVSLDHLFFNKKQTVFVNDSISPLDTVPRAVDIYGMRRFTIAGMVFPMQSYFMHPYFGLGVTINHIPRVEPLGTYRNGTQQQLVLQTIQEFRTAAAPIVIIGTQLKLLPASGFGQITITPANGNFFLWTGNNWRVSLEGGFRVNAGSSIDRLR
jgi:hypothetical protein